MPTGFTVYIEESHGPDGSLYRIPGAYAYAKTKAEAEKLAREIHGQDINIEIRPVGGEGPG